MRSNEIQNRFKMAIDSVEINVQDASCSFVDCLTSASSCMFKSCYAGKKVKKTKWFDKISDKPRKRVAPH